MSLILIFLVFFQCQNGPVVLSRSDKSLMERSVQSYLLFCECYENNGIEVNRGPLSSTFAYLLVEVVIKRLLKAT